jgi:hypothetical protein
MVRVGLPAGVIYTGTWYAQPVGLTAAALPAGWRRLHLATYAAIADATMPLPPGWSRDQVVARQYTSTADQPGIPGRSDRSRVLREWLPTEQESAMPTAEEYAAAVWATRPPTEGVDRPVAKARMDQVLADAYNKAGNIQKPGLTDLAAALARIEAQIGTGPVRVTLPDTLAAIAATNDPHMLVQLIAAAGTQLSVILNVPAPSASPTPQEPSA